MDAANAAPDFPRYTEADIRALTLGVCQVKLAKSYTQKHLDADGGYDIFVSSDIEGVICGKYSPGIRPANNTSISAGLDMVRVQ